MQPHTVSGYGEIQTTGLLKLKTMVLRWRVDAEAVFTVLHAMQTWSSDENSVCPSVRLSVCHTREL